MDRNSQLHTQSFLPFDSIRSGERKERWKDINEQDMAAVEAAEAGSIAALAPTLHACAQLAPLASTL